MGSNSLRGWVEVLVFAAAALILSFIPISVGNYTLAWAILPLVFFSLRRGLLQGLFAGALTGILVLLLKEGSPDFTENLVTQFGPVAFIGITGFFAKFTQRTLHNKRYSNAAVNIVTASFLGSLLYFIWEFIGSVSFSADALPSGASAYSTYFPIQGISFLITLAAVGTVLLLLAKFAPKSFIPKDTPFLSRKEKSRLLND